jgi:hypothetical protein
MSTQYFNFKSWPLKDPTRPLAVKAAPPAIKFPTTFRIIYTQKYFPNSPLPSLYNSVLTQIPQNKPTPITFCFSLSLSLSLSHLPRVSIKNLAFELIIGLWKFSMEDPTLHEDVESEEIYEPFFCCVCL